MKKLTLYLTLLCTILFLTNCKKENSPTEPEEKAPQTKLIDTLINNSTKDALISIAGKLNITIPRGTVPDGTSLIVEEVPNNEYPSDELIKVHKVYDVKLSSGTNFNNILTVKLNYDPALLQSGWRKEYLGAAYYNSPLKSWKQFSGVIVDSISKTITFQTNHLTPLSFTEFVTTGGYQHKMESTHFTIYYTYEKNNAVLSNDAYNGNKKEAWHFESGTPNYNPYYIQDLSHWLEESYSGFKSLGLKVPSEKVYVYVRALSGSDGEFGSVLGNIKINNTMTPDIESPNLTKPELLRSAAAHELLHYIQDYYYAVNIGGVGMWWLEATATQADRMIWKNNLSNYESEGFSKKNSASKGSMLHYCLSKSWDDCNSSPDWYVAGCFLNYLANYRSGAKASIAELIKIGGDLNKLSYYRTILDDYLKSKLSSQGIGEEFNDYVKYLYEKRNSSFQLSWSSQYDPDKKTEIDGKLSVSTQQKNISTSIPYLAARIIKLRNEDSEATDILVNIKSLPSDVKLYVYKYQNQKMVEEITGEQNDMLKISCPKKTFKDILLVNTSSSGNKSIEIDISFNLLKIDPEKIENGKTAQSYSFKAIFAGTLPDGVKYKWAVTDTAETFETTANTFNYSFKKPGTYKVKVDLKDKTGLTIASAESNIAISALDFLHRCPIVMFKLSGFMNVTETGESKNNFHEYSIDNNKVGLQGSWSGNTFSAKYKIGGTASELYEYTVDYTVTMADDGLSIKSFSAVYHKIKWEMGESSTRYISQTIDAAFSGTNIPYSNNSTKAIIFTLAGSKLKSNLTASQYNEKYYYIDGRLTYSVEINSLDWDNAYLIPGILIGFVVYP